MITLDNLKINLIRSVLEDTDESRLVEIYALYYDDDPFCLSDDEINNLTQQCE